MFPLKNRLVLECMFWVRRCNSPGGLAKELPKMECGGSVWCVWGFRVWGLGKKKEAHNISYIAIIYLGDPNIYIYILPLTVTTWH